MTAPIAGPSSGTQHVNERSVGVLSRDVRHQRVDTAKFFTIAEVAERLHVATRTVRRWIDSGELVAHRFGAVVRIAEGDLRAFLALHRVG